MAFLVNLTARAARDLVHLYAEINAEHSDAALKWYLGFKEAILGLGEQPNRCPVTPETDKFRHLLYGSKPHIYRAIYRVLEKQKRVEVLHIRHGARQNRVVRATSEHNYGDLVPSRSPRRAITPSITLPIGR